MSVRQTIMTKIISKGGLIGKVASLYIDSNKLSDQFIAECFDQCRNNSAKEHWGEDLIKEIKNYVAKKISQNYNLSNLI